LFYDTLMRYLVIPVLTNCRELENLIPFLVPTIHRASLTVHFVDDSTISLLGTLPLAIRMMIFFSVIPVLILLSMIRKILHHILSQLPDMTITFT
jgi:hypothetical protein